MLISDLVDFIASKASVVRFFLQLAVRQLLAVSIKYSQIREDNNNYKNELINASRRMQWVPCAPGIYETLKQ